MKDLLKNPVLYYIAIPAFVAVWPVLVFAVYLPDARENMNKQIQYYQDAQPVMEEILTLEPERLKLADPNNIETEFTYDWAVDQIVNLCNIQQAQYTLNPSLPQTSSGQRIQSANLSLKQVDITTFGRFLSMILTRWPQLQCTTLTISHKENLPDVWDITIDFKYYY